MGSFLPEFDFEIRDKKDIENLVADRFSGPEQEDEGIAETPIDESFPDEYLMALYINEIPWYADIIKYLACGVFHSEFSFEKKKRSGPTQSTIKERILSYTNIAQTKLFEDVYRKRK